jgi:hypothetical protein
MQYPLCKIPDVDYTIKDDIALSRYSLELMDFIIKLGIYCGCYSMSFSFFLYIILLSRVFGCYMVF